MEEHLNICLKKAQNTISHLHQKYQDKTTLPIELFKILNIKEEKLIYLLNQNLFYFENVIKVIEIIFYCESINGISKTLKPYDVNFHKLNKPRYDYINIGIEEFDEIICFISQYDINLVDNYILYLIKKIGSKNTISLTLEDFKDLYREKDYCKKMRFMIILWKVGKKEKKV
mgnify:CR=1 FL=1